MEPRYVDNFTTAVQALFDAFNEQAKESDEHFKVSAYDEQSEEYKYQIMSAVTSNVMACIFKTLSSEEPRYLHVWIDSKNRILTTFPKSATREELLWLCRCAEKYLTALPISQKEAKEQRG